MADPIVAPTGTTPVVVAPEVKDGKLTSEYLMTKVVVITGSLLAVLAAVSQVLGFLGQFAPGNQYVALAVGAAGLVTAMVRAAQYEAQRTTLKQNAQDSAQVVHVPTGDAAAATLDAAGAK